MSKGNRLRESRDRKELKGKRWRRSWGFVQQWLHGSSVARPCGGVGHCVTATGNRAKQPHKGCES